MIFAEQLGLVRQSMKRYFANIAEHLSSLTKPSRSRKPLTQKAPDLSPTNAFDMPLDFGTIITQEVKRNVR